LEIIFCVPPFLLSFQEDVTKEHELVHEANYLSFVVHFLTIGSSFALHQNGYSSVLCKQCFTERATPQGGGVTVADRKWAVYRLAKEQGKWITQLVEGPMSRPLAIKRAEALQCEAFEFEDEGHTFKRQPLPPIFLARHVFTGQIASD
jgi:hypothetical protein